MFRTLAFCTAAMLPVAAIAAMAMSASTYVMKAGAGDLYEIQSSKLVMGSTNPAIRSFASQMVTDHTKSTADVKAAAMQAGMHPKPPMLNAMQAKMIASLKRAHGTARDTMYITQQKAAHDQALALHTGYSTGGTSDPLKMVAANIAPVVQSHIQMLSTM